MAVLGQVPDLREGDCVRALDDIDYEHMPNVKKGFRGMVTGKGILWEGRNWLFDLQEQSGRYLFKERNAVIHRSMVEKMPETEGYGTIELPPRQVPVGTNPASIWHGLMGGVHPVHPSRSGAGKWMEQTRLCLTVFELDDSRERPVQAPVLQWWECEPGWAAQIFIYPACGFGPGQIRWASDPQKCAFRESSASPHNDNNRLMLGQCDWVQEFMFWIRPDSWYDHANRDTHFCQSSPGPNNDPRNPGACDPTHADQNCCSNQDICDQTSRGKARLFGSLQVGTMRTDSSGTGNFDDPDRRNHPPEEFEIQNPPYFSDSPDNDMQDPNTGLWILTGKTTHITPSSASASEPMPWHPPCDIGAGAICGPSASNPLHPDGSGRLTENRDKYPFEFKGLWQVTDLDV